MSGDEQSVSGSNESSLNACHSDMAGLPPGNGREETYFSRVSVHRQLVPSGSA